MTQVREQAESRAQLNAELQRVRQQSLAASRMNDFRAVARLTREAARLNRAILQVDGPALPRGTEMRGQFFSSEGLFDSGAPRLDRVAQLV